MNLQTICSVLNSCDVHTDEEYLRVLRRRQRIYIVMLALGAATAAVAALAELLEWEIALNAYQLGFYCGVGSGMTGGSLALLLRNRRIMKKPEKLRAERVKFTDERVREIGRRAIAVAGYVLLIAVYLIGLIGGMFYPKLLMALAALVVVFLAAYVTAFYVYNRIM